MSAAAASPYPHDPDLPDQVDGHPVVEPVGEQLWCTANHELFTGVLDEQPQKGDREAMAAYREAIDAARHMCSQRCPRFEECLRSAIEGPPIAGFVAGMTEGERKRHRRQTGVTPQPEVVSDALVGLPHVRLSHADRQSVDEAIRRMPDLSSAQIAEYVTASASTVKRRKRALARGDSSATPKGARDRVVSIDEHVHVYRSLCGE